MSNGRTDEMIRLQQQLSAFLIIKQFTKIYSFLLWKFVHFHRGVLEGILHIVLWELIRLPDGLVNRSFWRWDFSRVQLKSNWTVGKGLLTSDSKTFWKSRLILSKSLSLFFYCWFGNWFIWKELVSRSLWMMSRCSTGTYEIFRWPCEPIILSIRHFLWGSSQLVDMVFKELLRLSDPLAKGSFCRSDISWVQLKSNWTFRDRLLATDQDLVEQCRLILFKRQLIFLQCLIWKIIHLD